MQSGLLQDLMKNSEITPISMAPGRYLKVEKNKEQYHLLKMTKGQNGWEFALPFPNLNLLVS